MLFVGDTLIFTAHLILVKFERFPSRLILLLVHVVGKFYLLIKTSINVLSTIHIMIQLDVKTTREFPLNVLCLFVTIAIKLVNHV